MAGVQTSEVDAKLAQFNAGSRNAVFRQIFKEWTTYKKTNVMRNKKYERGRQLKVEIDI
jgi:hypothetical protein